MTDELLHRRPRVFGLSVSELASAIGARVVRDAGEGPVTGVSVDSADTRAGEAFIAIGGFTTHGAKYAGQAITGGARAIITDEQGLDLIGDAPGVALLEVADPRAVVGMAARLVYGDPAHDVQVIGVTGTNGKTTTSTILSQILARAHGESGLFGTVEVRLGQEASVSPRTTLEASVVHRLLALAREDHVPAVAMEVSSHAAHLGRVAGVRFAAVGFINLQHDHLDYHRTMESYFEAKATIFTPEYAERAVVCVDDEWGEKLAARCEIPVLTVATDKPADLIATDITAIGAGTRFTVVEGEDRHVIEMPLSSQIMVQNSMVAIGLARTLGIDWQDVTDAMATVSPAPGRMQVVGARSERHPLVMVDYAHTAEALEAILSTLRELTPGEVTIVFGSDGDRDRDKRPDLGQVAARLADRLYVTDENPRSEDPAAIRAAILAGVREVRPDMAGVTEGETRRQALTDAILAAGPRDTVVVTGKGAEPYQEIQGVMHPYNDVPVAREALTQREDA